MAKTSAIQMKEHPQPTTGTPVRKVASRAINDKAEKILYVQAGGRCEFHGCNKYLFRHHLTHDANNFSEKAHICAFNKGGPRYSEQRKANINDLDNLMLLCGVCHKQIDDDPTLYPVEKLQQFKADHESRILRLTEIKPDHKTKVVRVVSRINGDKVVITNADIKEAIFPRYPQDQQGIDIDLSEFPDDGNDGGAAFYTLSKELIISKIGQLYQRGVDTESVDHISVFALAPMPLLIFLGSQLSNKVAVELYQRHRDTQNWSWKAEGGIVPYKFHQVQKGTDHTKVALILSLSGPVRLETLATNIDKQFYVYEITLENQPLSPMFLFQKQDLDDFKQIYQQALRYISGEHRKPKELHVFPAVPAPIAVLCGRELLPKIDPVLLVYDDDRKQGGFQLKMRINER